MTPFYNSLQAHKASQLRLNEAAKTENRLRIVNNLPNEEVPLFTLVKPMQVNDPAQWDEAWFANYE